VVAMSWSGQEKQPRNHLVGTLSATITSAALIVTVLLVAGCGRATAHIGSSGPHATVTPTSPVLPGTPLSWTAGSLPLGNTMFSFGSSDSLSSMFIAPTDGNTAYSCVIPASASVGPGIWVTHDRAQHWTALAVLPPVAHQLSICTLIPDAADRSIMVASVSWARPTDLFGAPLQVAIKEYMQFVTFDGGAHWNQLNGPGPFELKWLATYHATTVAMLDTDASGGSENMWISTDQMQTWHELTQAPVGQPSINPATGALLVLGGTGNSQEQISESSDLDQHWTSYAMPIDSGNMPPLVSLPVGSQPWRICGIAGTVSVSPSSAGTLMCSLDSGRTWTSRPQLITTFDNTDKGLIVPQAANVVAVGADGTIYAVMPSSMWPMGISAGLYQLTPQATRWQPLTFPPGDAVDTTDIPGSGILWAVPGELGPGLAGPFPAAAV
jgi:hypothetical protein